MFAFDVSPSPVLNHSIITQPQLIFLTLTLVIDLYYKSDLRKHAKLLNLANNFVIADRDDWYASSSSLSLPPTDLSPMSPSSLALIKRASQAHPKYTDYAKDLKPKFILDIISKCKSKDMDYRAYEMQETENGPMWGDRLEKLKIMIAVWR